MSEQNKINNIPEQVKQLSKNEQIHLIENIELLRHATLTAKSDLPVRMTSLGGLGSELWKGVDIDKYLIEERQW